MRRSIALAAVVALIGSLALVSAAAGGGFWKAPPFSSIGIKNVYGIGNAYGLDPSGVNDVLRVYMETGSANEACLATMGEGNHSPTVIGVYCSARNLVLADAREHWGVIVTLMLQGPLVDVDGEPSWYSLNVYQEGAKFFGDPLPCFSFEGCS